MTGFIVILARPCWTAGRGLVDIAAGQTLRPDAMEERRLKSAANRNQARAGVA